MTHQSTLLQDFYRRYDPKLDNYYDSWEYLHDSSRVVYVDGEWRKIR